MAEIVRCPLRTIAFVSLLLGIGLASPAALAQQRVGIDSAVNPAAMGIPPGGVPRRLVLGQDVVFNERITTEAEGQTQILFVDESTLSVGPNANMVIDQFVYDPNTGTGKLAASLTRGVFRFVGGKLSKLDNAVTMRTPTATIGIRGGVMLVKLRSDCTASGSRLGATTCNALDVIFVYGKGVTVTGLNGVSQTITRPGFEVTVSGPGASPSNPAQSPRGSTAALLAQLDGRAGGNGGAQTVPTEVTVASSGIANAISANVTASIQAAAHTQPPAQQSQNVSPVVQLTQLNNQNVSVPGATVTSVAGGPSVAISNFPTLQPGTPISGTGGSPSMTPSMPQPMTVTQPMTPPPPAMTPPPPAMTPPPPAMTPPPPPPINIAGISGNLVLNGILTPYTAGQVADGVFSANTTSGPINVPVTPGSGHVSPDNTFFYGHLTTGAFVYGGQPVNPGFYQATSTSPSVLVIPLATGSIPFLSAQTTAALPAGLQASAYNSPLYLATPANNTFSNNPPALPTGATKALQASLAISGTGAGQSSAIVVLVGNVIKASPNGVDPGQPIINGVIHGSILANAMGQPIRIFSPYVTPADGNGNSFYGANGISGLAVSNRNCCTPGEVASNAFETNTATGMSTPYQFVQPAVTPTTPLPVPAGPQTPTQTLTGYFGGIMTKEPGTGPGSPIPYTLTGTTNITTNATNAQVAATLSGTDSLTPSTSGITNGIILGFGSTTTGATNARIAYVNDNLFAVMENTSRKATSYVNGVAVPVTDGNSGSNIYLVTQTAAPLPTSFLATGLCNGPCAYLQWGYWGGELDSGVGSTARIDVGHINFWVAGSMTTSLADIMDLQNHSFIGNYTGNLVGSVVNGTKQYLASGGLNASYNFGTQMLQNFSVNNYDGNSFKLPPIKVGLSGSNYTFGINVPGVTGSVSGGFYGPQAAETGGSFAFSKPGSTPSPYFTSGIFAAKR